MTPAEKFLEHKIAMETRLGQICGANEPTKAQRDQARREADEHVAAIEYEDWIKDEGEEVK